MAWHGLMWDALLAASETVWGKVNIFISVKQAINEPLA